MSQRSLAQPPSITPFDYVALPDEVDETAPSTNTATRFAKLQQWSKSTFTRLFRWLEQNKTFALSLIGTISILVAAPSFALVMHFGKKTFFPPSEPRLGFQSGSGSRSTFNIIWMCLMAVFAAVYKTLHFDVEGDRLTAVLRAVATPEVILAQAVIELRRAQRNVQLMRDASNGQWSLVHAYSKNMGAFRIVNAKGEHADFDQWVEWQKRHGTTDYYEQLRRSLANRSRKDVIAKSIACLQIFKVLVQTIARRAQSLYITELELMTTGYIICSLLTYTLWWHKPYSICEPIEVRLDDSVQRLTVSREAPKSGSRLGLRQRLVTNIEVIANRFLNKGFDNYMFAAAISVFGALFGGVHCAAWNATFPNTNGQLIWRTSCILLLGCPSIFAVCEANATNNSFSLGFFWRALSVFFVCVYVVGRIYLVLLIVYSFWSLPADAYAEVKWVSFIPQFS